MVETTVVHPDELPLEEWDDKSKGSVTWKTLISGDRTPTEKLVSGIAYFGPEENLKLHRHAQSEIIHVLDGNGTAIVGNRKIEMKRQSTVFVAGNEHHAFEAGSDGMTLVYFFPVSEFSEVVYEFD